MVKIGLDGLDIAFIGIISIVLIIGLAAIDKSVQETNHLLRLQQQELQRSANALDRLVSIQSGANRQTQVERNQ